MLLCQFCDAELTGIVTTYGSCPICKKAVINECWRCHMDAVHKDYYPEEVNVHTVAGDFSVDADEIPPDLVDFCDQMERGSFEAD